ncbi:MAG TPA: hypothetical protein VGQ76_19885 [Thermoanaerobaculia bacterium]|nr:hypothetical protein [Thermoanaerobaculia bacterium]
MFVLVWMAATVSAAPPPQASVAQPAVAAAEAPLSNKDVIKLAKLGLGDEVVIAKIKQAGNVAFDLTTDGLVQLKQNSVSGPIIAAMLERTTPKSVPGATSRASDGADTDALNQRQDVRIILGETETRLPASRGDLSATGMWPVVFTFLDYPGLRARTRTTNLRPTLVVRSEHDPKSYYYLAKLDVNAEEENNRSLKIEQKVSGFSATTRVVPAGRWYVEYDAVERAAGVWHITPTADLQAGEYGVVVPGGILYEFGVD